MNEKMNEIELGTGEGNVEMRFEDLSEEEQIKILEAMDEEDLYDCDDEEILGFEEEMGHLAVCEEVRRLENIVEPYEVDEEVKKDKFYKDGMILAQTIVAMVKEMTNNGIDYQNALQIANNLFLATQEKEAIGKIEKVKKVGML